MQQPARYENVQEIGKGAYSAVYKGRDRMTEGRYVAMKEVRIPLNAEEGIPMTTVREIGLLRQLDKFEHPNVVRYYHCVVFVYFDSEFNQHLGVLEHCSSSYEGTLLLCTVYLICISVYVVSVDVLMQLPVTGL